MSSRSLVILGLTILADLSCHSLNIRSRCSRSSVRTKAGLDNPGTRREWVSSVVSSVWVARASVAGALEIPDDVQEAEDLSRLQQGLKQLDALLENWDELTLNCKYAEVNKELLTTEKKEELLDAATKSALFNKGATTRTLCKTDAEVVRFVMGVGSDKNQKSGPPAMFAAKGLYDKSDAVVRPLLNVEPVLTRGFRSLGDRDSSSQDLYLEAMEKFSEAKSGLEATSYASGVADYSSIIAANTEEDNGAGSSSYLESSRKYALAARQALATIVRVLES